MSHLDMPMVMDWSYVSCRWERGANSAAGRLSPWIQFERTQPYLEFWLLLPQLGRERLGNGAIWGIPRLSRMVRAPTMATRLTSARPAGSSPGCSEPPPRPGLLVEQQTVQGKNRHQNHLIGPGIGDADVSHQGDQIAERIDNAEPELGGAPWRAGLQPAGSAMA